MIDPHDKTEAMPLPEQLNERERTMTDALTHDEAPIDASGQEGSGLLVVSGQVTPAKFHPLADLFPMIEGEAFAALVEDVRANGVRRPVVMFEGMILDGRNRYMAAREAGVSYPVVEFTGEDPVAYVISENIHRRHLTESQRAMVAAKIAKINREDNLVQNRTANLPIGPSTGEAAAQMKVSPRLVVAAKSIVRDGSPGLADAVDAGQVTVSAAAAVAKLPKEEQREIVAKGPDAIREAAKEVRKPKAEAEPKPKAPALPAGALTYEALVEENEALKAELETTKAKLEKITEERDRLKAQLRDHTADDKDKVIRRLTKEAENLKSARWRAEEKAAVWSRQVHGLKKRVAELEGTPIDIGAV